MASISWQSSEKTYLKCLTIQCPNFSLLFNFDGSSTRSVVHQGKLTKRHGFRTGQHQLVVFVNFANSRIQDVEIVAIISLLDNDIANAKFFGEHSIQQNLIFWEHFSMMNLAFSSSTLDCLSSRDLKRMLSTKMSEMRFRSCSDLGCTTASNGLTLKQYLISEVKCFKSPYLSGSNVSADTDTLRPLGCTGRATTGCCISATSSSSSSSSDSSEWSVQQIINPEHMKFVNTYVRCSPWVFPELLHAQLLGQGSFFSNTE
jgi:hypothetical protein